MRKYLVATAIGAMLLAGQAAASESSIVSLGDRVGANGSTANRLDDQGGSAAYLGLGAAVLIGLLIWGLSEGQGKGHPISP